ncbi:piggyBac transposable element-derived protein 3-like [Danaus plexippus]|uniref:piggyBac transposable element-derived protein 3-like n=1 Tax=Danaus plexippus TaxID=13037 RepID=UPI002AB2262B|nr:piggyBac transposable element-derived protein 3-like [Danaus plexippus]
MFSRDALRALEKDNQSEFELSSDDEDVGNNNNVPFARHVRLGADVVTQNQREYTPLDPPDEQEDEERSAFNYESEPEAPREPDIVEGEEEQVTPNAELFDYLTPKPNIKWRHRQINNTIPTDFLLPIALEPIVQDPICYYNRYVPVELFEQMAEMTNLYAVQSGKTRFKPTSSYEIEILFGLHMATGVFNYPVLKMYWENHISIPLFTNNMARDRFFELRNNLHLVDNMKKPTNCTDVFYKVRPIYNAIRSRCLEIPLEKELCVDEQIVPFTGKHSAKQYIKGNLVHGE